MQQRRRPRLRRKAEAEQHALDVVLILVAAAGLELSLGLAVTLQQFGRVSLGYLLLQRSHLLFTPVQIGEDGQHFRVDGVLAPGKGQGRLLPQIAQRQPGSPLHRAAARLQQAGQGQQQRRLAHAVGADQGHPVARLQRCRNLVKQFIRAKGVAQVGGGQDRHKAFYN